METQRILEARNGELMLEPELRSRYSDQHLILLVGEGNCSFSSCLATAFGAATNIVATTLDSRGVFLQKYGMEGEFNTSNLNRRGALVFHDFDACKMATQHKNLLCRIQMSYFDCIIFNFPHAGFLGREHDAHVMEKHKELVRLFFANARHMLLPGGQVHVSHKLGHPYDEWKLEEQAQLSGLRLVERVPFRRYHFPGYQNCRGDGTSAGKNFILGPADTYIFEARIEEPPASSLDVREPLGMSSTVLAHVKSLKEKAVRKAGVSEETSLHQVVADEVTRLEKLPLGKKKMKTLQNLKLALQQMYLENYPISLSCATDELPTSSLNVREPLGMSSTVLAQLQSLKEKAVCKAGASEETSFQQVVADEVTRLEKLPLGKKKMKTLEAPAEDLGGSFNEEHAKIIEMDMASLSNSTNVKCNSQYIGCIECILPALSPETNPVPPLNPETTLVPALSPEATLVPPLSPKSTLVPSLSPETKLEGTDLVSQVNPNKVLVPEKEDTTKSHLTLDTRLGLSDEFDGTISTLEKLEEAIKEEFTSSKQLLEIQLVAPLQRNFSYETVDLHVNSAWNVGDPIGMSSTIMVHLKSLKQAIRKARASQVTPLQQVVADEVARLEKLKDEEKLGKRKMKTLETLKSALQETILENLENLENLQSVEASVEALAQDLGIFLEEENEEITDMDMAVNCASLSSAANIESLGSQSSGCTKPLSPETGDRLFPVNPGNEVFEKAEDTTKSHDILEPSPQFSKVSAAESTIWTTIDKVEEDVKVDCQQEFQLPGIQLMDDVAPLLRKKESSDLEESSSLNEKLAGCLTVLPYLWEVLWRYLQRI